MLTNLNSAIILKILRKNIKEEIDLKFHNLKTLMVHQQPITSHKLIFALRNLVVQLKELN
jgi:hypothetical protein